VSTLLKPTGTPAERFTSRNPDDFPIPSTAQEDWRFTPLARIREFFEPFEPDGVTKPDVDAPEPVRTAVVAMDDAAVGRVLQPADRVSALAFSQASGALVVTIPAGTDLDAPVTVHVDGQGARTYGHLVIDAGANSQATVVLEHTGSMRTAVNVEVVVGDGARLAVVSAQNWDADTVHLAAHAALVGRDATYRHVNVTLGGAVVRIAPTVRFAGPGGSAEMLGVSFAGDGQHFESRLFLDHGEANCTSDVLYKNALRGDSARTVWIGDVRIRPAASGTQTYEMNRNLLLSDGARADSVPNLEIETGQIRGAGHASATGRFDDLQLFYLQARGIPEDEARRLVVRGFFADVVERIGVPELEQQIMTTIEARLGFVPELENES
jgi:Fe-S cluster assembly protein SufD